MTPVTREPASETRRAEALAAHDPQSLRDDEALARITDFAAALCDAPIALVSLVEATRQTFLSHTGVAMTETARDTSFCALAMLERGITVVPDATRDARFSAMSLVTGDAHIRFYAGAPLVADDGVPLGSLCVLDTRVRPDGLTPLQRQGLETLAEAVMARLRDSRDAATWRRTDRDTRRRLSDSEDRFRTLADTMPQMVWSTLPDGFHDYYNARWYEFTGVPAGSTDGEGWNDMFHPEDQVRAWEVWRRSLETGAPYQIEYRLRHVDGTYRWVLGRALPIRDEAGRITRWFGTCTDIHEQKLALHERELISQELSHRNKNIFSVISGLISFAARARPEFAPAASDLRERITALGRAHDFVRPHSPASRPTAQQNSLHGLLSELFEPYRRSAHQPVTVSGDAVLIDDRSATPLALLFHELATNAMKYGALSTDAGTVAVTVTLEDADAVLCWTERGGPAVAAPEVTHGFGSQLIELSAVRQLGGTVTREWQPNGLVVTVRVPIAAFHRP